MGVNFFMKSEEKSHMFNNQQFTPSLYEAPTFRHVVHLGIFVAFFVDFP